MSVVESKAEALPRSRVGRWLLPIFVAALAAGGIALGAMYYINSLPYEWTDDAFIEGEVVLVSPQVSGRVIRVYIVSNQKVKAGDLLLEIDPEYYEVQFALQQATVKLAETRKRTGESLLDLADVTTRADLQQAEAELAEARAGLDEAKAEVEASDAEANRAEQEFTRHQVDTESVFTQREKDFASASVRVARARLAKARKQVVAAKAAIDAALGRLANANSAPAQMQVRSSEVEQFAAEIDVERETLRQAELDLSHTKIYAPVSGRIARKAVNRGEVIQVGQRVMAIVSKDVWVVANFRETQLARMKPGQPVEIRVDTYRGRTLMGHVDSIQAGTGARFSLLPPQNATGNYVKVVQRLPVKILFDEPPSPDLLLVPGMSVVPKVRVQ